MNNNIAAILVGNDPEIMVKDMEDAVNTMTFDAEKHAHDVYSAVSINTIEDLVLSWIAVNSQVTCFDDRNEYSITCCKELRTKPFFKYWDSEKAEKTYELFQQVQIHGGNSSVKYLNSLSPSPVITMNLLIPQNMHPTNQQTYSSMIFQLLLIMYPDELSAEEVDMLKYVPFI